MSEIRTLDRSLPEEHWVLLAIARDAQVAEQWQDALDEYAIESEVRIEDAAVAGRSSAMPYVNAAIGHELVHHAAGMSAVVSSGLGLVTADTTDVVLDPASHA